MSEQKNAVITENDESMWLDETGIKYHLSQDISQISNSRYENIYYKGKLEIKYIKTAIIFRRRIILE